MPDLLQYLHVSMSITSWRLQDDKESGDNSIAYFERHLYVQPKVTNSTNKLSIVPSPDTF